MENYMLRKQNLKASRSSYIHTWQTSSKIKRDKEVLNLSVKGTIHQEDVTTKIHVLNIVAHNFIKQAELDMKGPIL
jgi:hypothetical protein